MRILITNDDGVNAPGIRVLARVAKKYGMPVICAPDRERSACGHAMTLRDPLRVHESEVEGCPAYAVNGVPVDCVNVGLTIAYPDGCDLVLSGVNAGPNLGFDITYSGTVAGAMEGAINGIPAISVSLATFVLEAPPRWETAERWLDENFSSLLAFQQPELGFLNINVPSIDYNELRGTRVVPMGKRVYKDRVERREDPWGRAYYWQGGAVVMKTNDENTDVRSVMDGFVSVTPISVNWTDQSSLQNLESALVPRNH